MLWTFACGVSDTSYGLFELSYGFFCQFFPFSNCCDFVRGLVVFVCVFAQLLWCGVAWFSLMLWTLKSWALKSLALKSGRWKSWKDFFLYLDSFPVAFCVCCVCAKSATHCWVSFCWRVCSNLVVCRFVDHVLARRPLDLCRVLTDLCGLVHVCEWRNLRFFVREFLQVTVLRHGGSSVC